MQGRRHGRGVLAVVSVKVRTFGLSVNLGTGSSPAAAPLGEHGKLYATNVFPCEAREQGKIAQLLPVPAIMLNGRQNNLLKFRLTPPADVL